MIEHPYPTPATVKRLFAVSGNQCAFEKCELPLVDKDSGKVTGRICHINSRREKGPRFLTAQTEDENRHFDNLILMCPIHHDVIDSDVKSYSTERLKEIKEGHESKFAEKIVETEDKNINKLIQNINIESIKIDSFFAVHNNKGQVANNIINESSDNAKIFLLERKISSLRKLESVYESILPKKISPDMDWSDFILDIAYSFDSIKRNLLGFKMEYSAYLDDATELLIDECLGYCSEGQFGVNYMDAHVSNDSYDYAEKLYKKVTQFLKEYKEGIRNYINNNA
jgi:hypothetical protein